MQIHDIVGLVYDTSYISDPKCNYHWMFPHIHDLESKVRDQVHNELFPEWLISEEGWWVGRSVRWAWVGRIIT